MSILWRLGGVIVSWLLITHINSPEATLRCRSAWWPLSERFCCALAALVGTACPSRGRGAAPLSRGSAHPSGVCTRGLRFGAFSRASTEFLRALALPPSLAVGFCITSSCLQSTSSSPELSAPASVPALPSCFLLKGVKQKIAQYFSNFHKRDGSPCSCRVGGDRAVCPAPVPPLCLSPGAGEPPPADVSSAAARVLPRCERGRKIGHLPWVTATATPGASACGKRNGGMNICVSPGAGGSAGARGLPGNAPRWLLEGGCCGRKRGGWGERGLGWACRWGAESPPQDGGFGWRRYGDVP